MWVPAVRPEDEKPVEKRLDISHVGFTFRKDPEDTTMLLSTQTHCYIKQSYEQSLKDGVWQLNLKSRQWQMFLSKHH